jgi:ATP-dependent DNA helicase RecG
VNQSIQKILQQPESKQLEFKQDLSSPKPMMKTLIAFANTAGGSLIIGVGDKGEVIGVENPLDEEERLASLIADHVTPRLVPSIEMVTIEDKTLLVVEVFLSNTRPHWLKSLDPEAGTFVRLGSTNRQADRALIADLHRSVEGVAYDQMPMPELTIDDLDINAAQQIFASKRETIRASWFRPRERYCFSVKSAPFTLMMPGFSVVVLLVPIKPTFLTILSSTIICHRLLTVLCCFSRNTP